MFVIQPSMTNPILLLAVTFIATPQLLAAAPEELNDNWHQWRGPTATGAAPTAIPPVAWDAETNIQWKTRIPGDGSASPIVWRDRVYVTSAVNTERKAEARPQPDARARTLPPPFYHEFIVSCLARHTGELLWRTVVCEAVPHEGLHSTNSYAAASPTTDGQQLYVSFGSRGIYCLDLDGNVIWQRDLGEMRTRLGWGEATTPAVHGQSLVVNWDHEDDSFIEVLDTADGKTRWKEPRDEPTSWATPLILNHSGGVQVIVSATNRVRSYDLSDGEVLWQCGGQTVNVIPSPVAADGVVYCMSGYRGSNALAIQLNARGDITNKETLWRYQRGTPYVPSPLLYGDRLYFTRANSAVLTCLDRRSGAPIIREQRLPGLNNVYASPVAAAGRIYIVGRDGTTVVLRDGTELDVLAVNRLDDPIDASPALVGEQIFLRSRKYLYCLAEK